MSDSARIRGSISRPTPRAQTGIHRATASRASISSTRRGRNSRALGSPAHRRRDPAEIRSAEWRGRGIKVPAPRFSAQSEDSSLEIVEQGQGPAAARAGRGRTARRPALSADRGRRASSRRCRAPQASQFFAVSLIDRSTAAGLVPLATPPVRAMKRIGTSMKRAPP